MLAVRAFTLRQPALLAALLACALLVRLLVPAGFMPAVGGGGVALALCPNGTPVGTAMPAMHHDTDPDRPHGAPEQPCGYAGLAAPAIGTADPVLPSAALAFVLPPAPHGAIRKPPIAPPRLRPPLRAPPRTA